MNKPKVGQKVHVIEDGTNSYRYRKHQGLPPRTFEGVVVKVGNKYFTVKFGVSYVQEIQFTIERWREKSDYTPDYSLWESKEAYDLSVETYKLFNELKPAFDGYNTPKWATPEKLRKIKEIIGE